MKFRFQNIILISILTTVFSCQNNRNIEGNYSICHKGYYREIYFKKDSIRAASDNEWIKLSKWRKIKLENDILHFETFGEWRDSSKVKIEFTGKNNIELKNLKSGETLYLEPITQKINFEKSNEFWNGFNKRQNSKNCK